MTTQDNALRALIARATLTYWLSAPHPQQVEDADYWISRFESIGPFRASVAVTVDQETLATEGNIETITRLTDYAPVTVYRGSSERGNTRLSWTPDYPIAHAVAYSQGPRSHIWQTTPRRVFGIINVTRTYLTPVGEDTETWSVWIIEPSEITEVDRWRNPDTPATDDAWTERGIDYAEAASVVSSWCNWNPLGASPEENYGRQWWADAFDRLGQFAGIADTSGSPIQVAPAKDLRPGPLYRAATPEQADGLAWTTEPDAALHYQTIRDPRAQLWTADAGKVYGQVWHDHYGQLQYVEWLVQPINIRPYEVTETVTATSSGTATTDTTPTDEHTTTAHA